MDFGTIAERFGKRADEIEAKRRAIYEKHGLTVSPDKLREEAELQAYREFRKTDILNDEKPQH